MSTPLPDSFFKLEVKEVLRLLGPTMSSVGYRGSSNLQVLTIAFSKLLDSVSLVIIPQFDFSILCFHSKVLTALYYCHCDIFSTSILILLLF